MPSLFSLRKKRQRGGTMILMTIMTPLFMLPIVGLGIDGARGYIVQSKLSAAVDGAGLGAGRLIGTNANTQEIAGEFLNTNFPAGYWGTSNFQSNITYTRSNGRDTINVSATVDLPLTFIRLLGMNKVTVGANATVTRRVTRVVMVLDRSGSMSGAPFTAMQTGAEFFASHFTPGYDELGLVVFNGSGIVAYPVTRPYNSSTSSAGGPDKSFATDAQNQVGPIFDSLRSMAAGGGTGTIEGLALAYIEMQKAHNRDLALNGLDNTMNTIVLFTDGVPDALTVYANDPANNSLKAAGSTSCNYNPATAGNPNTQMIGYIVAAGQPRDPFTGTGNWATPWGIMSAFAYDNGQSLTFWLGTGANKYYSLKQPIDKTAGCLYLGEGAPGSSSDPRPACDNNSSKCVLNDLKQVPPTDIYGNSTTGSAYTNSLMDDGTNTWRPNTTTANFNDPSSSGSTGGGYNLAAASWNATVAAGSTIRNQTTMNPITIITIGYTGNGGTDVALLKGLANTSDSYSYNPSQPVGKFYKTKTPSDLIDAFNQVASSVMRLAQ